MSRPSSYQTASLATFLSAASNATAGHIRWPASSKRTPSYAEAFDAQKAMSPLPFGGEFKAKATPGGEPVVICYRGVGGGPPARKRIDAVSSGSLRSRIRDIYYKASGSIHGQENSVSFGILQETLAVVNNLYREHNQAYVAARKQAGNHAA